MSSNDDYFRHLRKFLEDRPRLAEIDAEGQAALRRAQLRLMEEISRGGGGIGGAAIGGPIPPSYPTSEIQETYRGESPEPPKPAPLPTPTEIVAHLDQYVMGQERAKKALAVGIYFHYHRIREKKPNFRKSNICLVGPTGCGKTYLLSLITAFLKIPFVVIDATDITPEGYVGRSAEQFIGELRHKYDGEEEQVEQALVFIDEGDKIAHGASATNDGFKTVASQQAFLKILEGKEVRGVSTEKMLFVLGGAFSHITARKDYSGKITTEDLVESGFIPEFAGRFPVITTLDGLTEEDLERILLGSKDSILEEFKALFRDYGGEIEFEPEAVKAMARVAKSYDTGARGLRRVVENVVGDMLFELPEKKGAVKVTKELVLERCPVAEKKPQQVRIMPVPLFSMN